MQNETLKATLCINIYNWNKNEFPRQWRKIKPKNDEMEPSFENVKGIINFGSSESRTGQQKTWDSQNNNPQDDAT